MKGATAEKIKDAAENYIRIGGFNSFSFRDIAADLGIKSASVHYHFPTKEGLAAAVAKRYTERFIEQLDEIHSRTKDPRNKLLFYTQMYRQAIQGETTGCLCGILAAETGILPKPVALEAHNFFEMNIEWLTGVYAEISGKPSDDSENVEQAHFILASLEGALLVAKVFNTVEAFDKSVQPLLESFSGNDF